MKPGIPIAAQRRARLTANARVRNIDFEAVLTRHLDPMNEERLALLTRFEHESAPKPLSCERILAAMFIPALKLAREPERGGKNFLRLLGRAYADPAPFIRQLAPLPDASELDGKAAREFPTRGSFRSVSCGHSCGWPPSSSASLPWRT